MAEQAEIIDTVISLAEEVMNEAEAFRTTLDNCEEAFRQARQLDRAALDIEFEIRPKLYRTALLTLETIMEYLTEESGRRSVRYGYRNVFERGRWAIDGIYKGAQEIIDRLRGLRKGDKMTEINYRITKIKKQVDKIMELVDEFYRISMEEADILRAPIRDVYGGAQRVYAAVERLYNATMKLGDTGIEREELEKIYETARIIYSDAEELLGYAETLFKAYVDAVNILEEKVRAAKDELESR